MSTSVTVFDEEQADQLIDSLVSTLEAGLPVGVFRQLSDDTLLRTTGTIERLGRAVDARRVAAAAEVGHRSRATLGAGSLAVRKGCRDATELLRRVTRSSTFTVRRLLKLGTETRVQEAISGDLFPPRFPHIATALQAGQIGVDAASVIVTELAPTLSHADAEAVRGAEAELVAAATGTGPESPVPATPEELKLQAVVWRAFLDQDGTLPTEEKAMTRRAFSPGSYNSLDGLVHGKYALMPETHARLGQIFNACLTPKTAPTFLPADGTESLGSDGTEAVRPEGTGTVPLEGTDLTGTEGTGTSTEVSTEPVAGPVDPRTPDQQRHDILAAMIDCFARSGQTPTIGGASPTVLVTVTADTLTSGHGAGFATLGGLAGETIPLSLRAVHQMICTGGTQTVTLDPNGAIISLGSEQRCFTPAQRKAITVRDGGCIIPGCAAPAAGSEIHHVLADTDGGPTHTNNGVLLCWFHHRTIATSGWQITMINQIPHVKAPPWLHGDGKWHPTTKSPTRLTNRLNHDHHQSERGEPDKPEDANTA